MSDLSSSPAINIPETLSATGITASQARQLFDGNPDGMYFGNLFVGPNNKMQMGTKANVDGSGIPMVPSVASDGLSIFIDTGGVALAASTDSKAIQGRYLIGTVPGTGDLSITGVEGHVKTVVSVNVGGNIDGVRGHLESAGAFTLTGSINTLRTCVGAYLDLDSSLGTVAASTIVSAFGVHPASFAATMTGRSTIIHVTNPMASTWGSFLELSSATGCTQDTAAGVTGGKFLKVYLNGTLYTIAMLTA